VFGSFEKKYQWKKKKTEQPAMVAKIRRYKPDSGTAGWILATVLNSDNTNQIPKFKDIGQQIQAINKLQWSAVMNFHKRACKNEKFKFRNGFLVLKIGNHFSKIKEVFFNQIENDFR
jgi:hypothetical protein